MNDAHPLLHSYTPHPDALEDARAFHVTPDAQRRVLCRLEDVILCCAYFHDATQPDGEAQAEAVRVLFYAASGLTVFLEAPGPITATLTHARLWAARHLHTARFPFTPEDLHAFRAAFDAPDTHLPLWAARAQQAGDAREAGRLTAWQTVTRLLEALPPVEDGEAEDLTHTALQALTVPRPALSLN